MNAGHIVQENPYQAPLSQLSQEIAPWRPTISQILFSFEGRIGRLSYWLSVIGLSFSWGIFGYFVDDIGITRLPEPDRLLSTLSGIYGLAILWVSFAVQVKRWHDRDKSGWWCLINLMPVIGTLWSFIELGLLSGDDELNRYGPPQA